LPQPEFQTAEGTIVVIVFQKQIAYWRSGHAPLFLDFPGASIAAITVSVCPPPLFLIKYVTFFLHESQFRTILIYKAILL
jgi:hypothetical protein